MSGLALLAIVVLAVVCRLWWWQYRVARLTRRRDNADRQLNQTLRRWW